MKKLENETIPARAREATALLASRVPESYIYFVASRNEGNGIHLTLLVLTKERTALDPCDLACELAQKLAGVTACILLHTYTQLAPRAPDCRAFFYDCVREARCLHAGLGTRPQVSPLPDGGREAVAQFAFDRLALAESLMQSARRRDGVHNLIGLSELRQVVALSATAILRVGMGYLPQHVNVGFLLHLCEYVVPCREALLGGAEGRKWQRLLSNGPKALLHAPRLGVSAADYALALRKTFECNTIAVNAVARLLLQQSSTSKLPCHGQSALA